MALTECSAPGAHQYYLPEIPGLRRSVKTPDGSRHFLYRYSSHFLQLCICRSWPSTSAQILIEAVVSPHVLRRHLRALEVFNHLWHRGAVPGRLLSAAANFDRLRFVLRALDGSLAGASHREIAAGLIGVDRVRDSWRNDNDNLKNRIRRAVQRGRMLMTKDYRRFLAESRSSRNFVPF